MVARQPCHHHRDRLQDAHHFKLHPAKKPRLLPLRPCRLHSAQFADRNKLEDRQSKRTGWRLTQYSGTRWRILLIGSHHGGLRSLESVRDSLMKANKMARVGQVEGTCRICLESSPVAASSFSKFSESLIMEEDRLISPCACSGTQAFVHFKCLRRWQRAVMSSRRPGASQGPALVCSVCTHKFSVAPPRPAISYQVWKAMTGYSCEVAGLLIILCACYVALTGYNLQAIIEELQTGLAIAREVFPCSFLVNLDERCLSRSCSIQNSPVINFQSSSWDHVKSLDDEEYRNANSLLGSRVRFGWTNLHPGTLLVATHAMPSPFFFGTVVLLYEHQRCSGSRGLILNVNLEREKIIQWETDVLGPGNVLRGLAHGVGGPVAQDEWSILHRCSGCTMVEGMGKKACSRLLGTELLPGIYLGKDLVPVLQHLNCLNMSQDLGEVEMGCSRKGAQECKGNTPSNRRGNLSAAEGGHSRTGDPILHQVLHGHAEWYVGQLGSEVRRGLWVAKENASDLLLSTPIDGLWHALINQ